MIDLLFDSEAFKVAPADMPFIYTSGLIGPYFINTHYLCGGKEVATEVLDLIDAEAEKEGFQEKLTKKLEEVYQSSEIYKKTIDKTVELIKSSAIKFDLVSGGQRRDWFFSPIVAAHLNKPCIWIYKDGSTFDSSGKEIKDLNSASVINVADLLTIGSSYQRAWHPELKKRNASLNYAFNIVDRNQGGVANLEELGIKKVLSIFNVDNNFFDMALSKDLIKKEQHSVLVNYLKDSSSSMKKFLVENPEFIEKARNSNNSKTKSRVDMLLEKDLYEVFKA